MWRRGWCRNPRLYTPQQSHLVDQDALDCNRGLGSLWEPGDDAGERGADRDTAPTRQPLRFFAPQPQLAFAGTGMVMSSSDFGSSNGGDGGPTAGPGRPDRPGVVVGQERTVSYQPEERYWTDYLRIALPVMGLLLLIGLFWYWAGELIGNDDEPPPTVELANGGDGGTRAQVLDAGTPTPPAETPTEPIVVNGGAPESPTPRAEVTTPTPAVQEEPPAVATEPAAPPEENASDTDPPAGEADPQMGPGVTVITNDTQVNLRQEPSRFATSVAMLDAETALEITGDASPNQDDEEGQWWPVTVQDTGQVGWVREDFLQIPPE